MSNVYEKLQEARVKLQNQKIKKSGKNNYSGFTYFEIADFIPHVNQIFLELKLCSNFSIKENIAYLEIINAEKIDETTVFTMPTTSLELKGCSAIQALGGVNTYCRRYLYLNALEIAESDMLDANAGNIEEKPKKQTVAKPVNESSELPQGFITKEEIEILRKANSKSWAKAMTQYGGKIPYDIYYKLLEESEESEDKTSH